MIYERMKDIRTYFDNTQNELADYLKVSRSTYAGWENGIDAIPLTKLNDFCNYYGISLDYICGLSATKKYDLINDKVGKILIHTYPLIEFAKHYKVSIDYLCGKIKDSEIK